MAPDTIAKIFNFVTQVIGGLPPLNSVQNDVKAGLLVFDAGVQANLFKGESPLIHAITDAERVGEATLNNIATGQLAELGSKKLQYPEGVDEVLVFAVRKYQVGTPPADSPAARLKTENGY